MSLILFHFPTSFFGKVRCCRAPGFFAPPKTNQFSKKSIFQKKTLDIFRSPLYNSKAVSTNAAIAQPVERILGKDEVASSNLASSSKKRTKTKWSWFFFCAAPPDLNDLNASIRWTLARDGSTEANLYFCPVPRKGQKCKQI